MQYGLGFNALGFSGLGLGLRVSKLCPEERGSTKAHASLGFTRA